MKKNPIVLVLGGARSGKSRFALELAERAFRRPLYLATAEALDPEMRRRIRRHKQERARHWQCVEEPLAIAEVLRRPPPCDGILVDCLTLWTTNALLREKPKGFERRKAELLNALRRPPCPVILVSNEVGLGLVPPTPLGRQFRDLAGWLNQDLATTADVVVFVVSGLPLALKGRLPKGMTPS